MVKESISKEDISNAREKKKNTKKEVARGSIYGANYLAGTIYPGLGNPYASIGMATLDVCAKAIPDFYNSSIYGLTKTGTGAFFLGKTIYDLASIASGDLDQLAEIPFDASMAYQQIRDIGERYESDTKPRKKKFLEEIVDFGNLFKKKKGSQSSNMGNAQSQGTNYQPNPAGNQNTP